MQYSMNLNLSILVKVFSNCQPQRPHKFVVCKSGMLLS